MAEQQYKYWAFISYSHQDRSWANWLHKSLETYRVPRRLVGREHWSGAVPRRLLPIFRDRDELPSSAELGSVLNEALRQSRYLIVICSPQSATSRWVNEEVKYFKSLGRGNRVLPLIIGGEPDASSKPGGGLAECLPPAIRFEVDANGELSQRRAEPIAADARGGKDGRANARLKLIAGLINVGLDELKQRERQRQILRRVFATAAVVALTLLAGLGWRWQQAEKHRALEAQALQTRIAQLYENGRQELLAHNEARAAVYLNEAYKLGVDTPALRFMLARAMRVVDAQVLRVQTGSPVILANLSPDGRHFFTIGQDRILQIWDASTGQRLQEYPLGSDTGQLAAWFSPKSSWILVHSVTISDQSQRLRILDANTGKLIKEFSPGGNIRGSMPMPSDNQDRRVAYLRSDRSVMIEDLKNGRTWHLPGQYSIARFCNDQRLLIVGSEQGEVSLFERETSQLVRQFRGLHGAVVALDSSADCETLAGGSAKGEIRVWRTATGEVLMTGGHPQSVIDLQLNPVGSRLMGLTRGGVNVWDGRNGALLFAAKFFDPKNILAAFSSSGSLLASSVNSRLAMIDPVQGQELYTLDGHLGAARNFNFGALDTQMISAGSDGSAILWNLPGKLTKDFAVGSSALVQPESPEPVEVQTAFNHRGDAFFYGGAQGASELHGTASWRVPGSNRHAPIGAIAFSPDDRVIAAGDMAQTVQLRNASSGAIISEWPGIGGRIRALSFSPDGSMLATVVRTNVLKAQLHQVSDGKDVADFDIDWPRAQSFSPDGSAYVVGLRGELKLWDVERQSVRWSLRLSSGQTKDERVAALAFSPGGQTLLAALVRQHAYLLSAADGKLIREIDAPAAGGLYAAAFSPDGKKIAFGDFGKSVFVWRTAENHLTTLLGHVGEVRAVSFSPDSALLLSAGSDGTAKIWDVEKEELLDTSSVHEGPVSWYGAEFSATGDKALTGGTDGTAKILNVSQEHRDPKQIAALLECRVAWRLSGVELVPVAPQTENCSVNP